MWNCGYMRSNDSYHMVSQSCVSQQISRCTQSVPFLRRSTSIVVLLDSRISPPPRARSPQALRFSSLGLPRIAAELSTLH